MPAVQIFGVFADDNKIDVFGSFAGQGCFDTRIQFYGSQVDVLIELKSQFEQQAFFDHAGRHVRMSHGTQKDRVKTPQMIYSPGGKYFSGAEKPLTAVIQWCDFAVEPLQITDGVQNLDGFRGDFGTRTIPADHGDFERRHAIRPG